MIDRTEDAATDLIADSFQQYLDQVVGGDPDAETVAALEVTFYAGFYAGLRSAATLTRLAQTAARKATIRAEARNRDVLAPIDDGVYPAPSIFRPDD